MSQKENALILVTDDTFVEGFLTTLGSILASSDLSQFSVYVGNTGSAPLVQNWEQALSLCDRFHFPRDRCHQIQVDLSEYLNCHPMPDGSHHSYARYYVASKLKEPRAISLDCDLLVLGDLSKLAQLLPEGSPIAAAQDRYLLTHEADGQKIDGAYPPANTPYFNAGVMVINLEQIDSEYFAKEFTKLSSRITEQKYSDQTSMNVLFMNQWTALPIHWNMLTVSPNPATLEEEGEPTRIFHFVTKEKPWTTATLDLPNIFWHSVAENLGVHVSPELIADQEAKIDAYLKRNRFKLRLKKLSYAFRPKRKHKADKIQRLLNLPEEVSRISDYLKQHNLGEIPSRFQKLNSSQTK